MILNSEKFLSSVFESWIFKITERSGESFFNFSRKRSIFSLSCKLKIRGDVEQPHKNAIVFDTIWLDKDTENWKGWYDHRKIHKILLTQEKPKLEFHDCDECVQYINGLCMRVTIDKKFDEYRNADVNELRYLSYQPSLVGNPGDSIQTNNIESLEMPEGDGSDLPFWLKLLSGSHFAHTNKNLNNVIYMPLNI